MLGPERTCLSWIKQTSPDNVMVKYLQIQNEPTKIPKVLLGTKVLSILHTIDSYKVSQTYRK